MGYRVSQGVVFVKVPLPKEVVELAKIRGVEVEELAKAAETLLLLEIVSMESNLKMEDALEIADEVTRKVWARLKSTMQP
ncbi:MAG: hypothetical protein QXE01_09655 [Sulfolobales archaeon]